MHRFLVLLALVAVSHAQKSVDAPQPGLVEIPYEQTPIPAPPAATFVGVIDSVSPVPSPTITVPHSLGGVVDVPHTPIQLPSGGVQESTAEYDIPQPIVSVPGPVIQEKPVVFNVPQDIIQVPRPIIRHRPILYTVPHILKVQRPIIRHNRVLYDVSRATVSKSGYQSAPQAIPVAYETPAVAVSAFAHAKGGYSQ